MFLIPIYMQQERPKLCKGCNLCVKRPASEVPHGSKFTHFCLMLDKPMSGRSLIAEDKQYKVRCKPNEYRKQYCRYNGEWPTCKEEIEKYNIRQALLPL